ncbi:4'-phosphopantetheinyl transferase superfamily protein [Kitasatospora sp. NBC_01246]|uniref:4'-phosphopantetheinyl transferase family protein n=1 Tax=Kitasatospora sp. NBC_01246 TaxID=2903570 RepID=UPI002E2F76FF|nr:4'-phosphopantetheinyl transferase superfamily protein [Kitasatospora sp. NBC_01246]
MTDPGNSTIGPPVGRPRRVAALDGSWDGVRADLAAYGTAVVHADLADLVPVPPGGGEPRGPLDRDRSRYLDLAHPEVRHRHAASRALLEHAAAALPDGGPDAPELAYGPTGRPYLRGCDRVDISLSQADGLLLLGITTRGLIGVDAEPAERPMHQGGLSRQVCTAYELITLAAQAEEERNPALVRLWTLKEAYRKATGQGMRFDFTEFGFGPDGRPVPVRRPDGSTGTGEEWGFHTFELDSGYRVGVAVYDAGPDPLEDMNMTIGPDHGRA